MVFIARDQLDTVIRTVHEISYMRIMTQRSNRRGVNPRMRLYFHSTHHLDLMYNTWEELDASYETLISLMNGG